MLPVPVEQVESVFLRFVQVKRLLDDLAHVVVLDIVIILNLKEVLVLENVERFGFLPFMDLDLAGWVWHVGSVLDR